MAAIYEVKNQMTSDYESRVTKRMHKGSQGGEDHYYSLLVSMFKEELVSRGWCVRAAARARPALAWKKSDVPHMPISLTPVSAEPSIQAANKVTISPTRAPAPKSMIESFQISVGLEPRLQT